MPKKLSIPVTLTLTDLPEVRVMVEHLEQAVELLADIAPANRAHGWHQEECWWTVDEWRDSKAWDLAAERHPFPPPAERPEDWWSSGQAHAIEEARRAAAAEIAPTLGEPTVEDLCDDACPYPKIRRLLEQIAGKEET